MGIGGLWHEGSRRHRERRGAPSEAPGAAGSALRSRVAKRALAATERHGGLSCPVETCSFCLSRAWEALSPTEGVCIS